MKHAIWLVAAVLSAFVQSVQAGGVYTSYVGGYRKATVPIRAEFVAEGRTIGIGSGSGFLVHYMKSGKVYDFLITAKHVLKDGNQVVVLYNRVPLPGDYPDRSLIHAQTYPLERGKRRYWAAPANESVDVAVVFIREWASQEEQAQATERAQQDYKGGSGSSVVVENASILFEKGITVEDLNPEDQLLDIVYMGYPLGLVSQVAAVPIVRSGSIALASLRGVQNYPPEAFLISGHLFPGNSGGPVILRRTHISMDAGRIDIQTAIAGVVSQSVEYNDIAVSIQTKRQRITFEENTGLGVVYPSTFIEEAINNYLKM